MATRRFTLAAAAALAASSLLLASVPTTWSAAPAAPAAPRGGGPGGGPGAPRFRAAPPGPPAPVPPEVAIPRPTPEEVAKINADLTQFVESNTSPDKELLKKYESLINVPAPRPNTCIMPVQTNQRSPQRHDPFVAQAKAGNIDILFEGDSITDWWTRNGPIAFKKYFGDQKVANFAIAGDSTQGVLWGLQNGEGQGFQPKAIMLMIGTNNAGVNTGPEIAEGIGAIVLENRKDFPDAKIMLLAIFPRGPGPTDRFRLINDEANKRIAKLADNQHVFYVDLTPKFTDENGVLLPGSFLGDNLHPTEKGYEIWGAAVADTLKSWVK